MQPWTRPLDRPIPNLAVLFAAWKLLLLLVATVSPGPGYDTSTALALARQHDNSGLPPGLHHISEKLTRWDGIYFVTAAHRGYQFEQEWAFGWGFTKLIALCTAALRSLGVPAYNGLESLVAISVAHVAHLFSVIVLFKLTLAVCGRASGRTAFAAAALHIISPAGLFLSGPYAESSCAFLSFAGCLNFVKSFGSNNGRTSASGDFLLILSGIMFGAATTFRSNGILNGLLLLEEAFRVLFRLKNGLKVETLRRLIAAGLGGLFVLAGFLLPQLVAYQEYCGVPSAERRPWCEKTVPSVYTFVQDYYWDCGFLRYWKLSNVPLFLLATPMFCILVKSGLWAWTYSPQKSPTNGKGRADQVNAQADSFNFVRSFGVSQLLLTALTLTTAHVQIITRISSAYPVCLWYVAISAQKSNGWMVGHMVQFVVMYAVIQGALFASFLPPA